MVDSDKLLHLDSQLCFPLYAASRLFTKAYAPLLKPLNITYPQYLVLMVLWQHGPQPVKAISQRLFLESNTLTPLLKRLEQKQIVSRKRNQADERSVVIALTKTGEKLKEEAKHIPEKLIHSLNSNQTSTEEITQFKTTLLKLVNVLNHQPNNTDISPCAEE